MKVGVNKPTRGDSTIRQTATDMARELSNGFQAHDDKRRDDAVEAFFAVDRRQFSYLNDSEARDAAIAFVDALWAKDEIEFQFLRNGDIEREGIKKADYHRVKQKLRKRAWITGADPRYAETKAKAWRHHKSDDDYWTPFMKSQVYELRAALQSPSYPDKRRGGKAGPGPEPMRYVLAFELHDMHTPKHWKQGEEVMVPYFERILREIQ